MADPSDRDKLAERVRELEAEVAELRAESARLQSGALPPYVAAHLENLARIGIMVAADIKSSYLARACRWLLRTLDEDHPIGDVIAAAVVVAWHWGERDRDLLLRQVKAFKRREPKWSSVEEWFSRVCEEAKGRGRPPEVPQVMVVSLMEEGLRGSALVRKICDETGVDERTAWRAIARRKRQNGMVYLLKRDADGQILVRALPPY
jgi:hypothetical protein